MAVDITSKSVSELQNILDNYRRLGRTSEPLYSETLEEYERRQSRGLEIKKTCNAILQAAKGGKYITYREIAQQSGCEWTSVHFPMSKHLDNVIHWCHSKGFPLITAIIVSQDDNQLSDIAIRSLSQVARSLGLAKGQTDEDFVRSEQERVFQWAREQGP